MVTRIEMRGRDGPLLTEVEHIQSERLQFLPSVEQQAIHKCSYKKAQETPAAEETAREVPRQTYSCLYLR
jgi:hypothetical protein